MSFKTEKNEKSVIISRCGQTVVDILTARLYGRSIRKMCRVRNLPTGKKMVRLRTTTKITIARTHIGMRLRADEFYIECIEAREGAPLEYELI
jgi:hypothetical protein